MGCDAVGWPADDPRIIEIVDIMERLAWRAAEAGELGDDDIEQSFVDLMDALPTASAGGRRIIALLEKRGWKGWTRIEQVPPRQPSAGDGA